ncbi:MAG TPA: 4Fe-4S binding protein [Roseovarius sp.]|nr:4Fe-4S binding protein [Roseovarius sp.]
MHDATAISRRQLLRGRPRPEPFRPRPPAISAESLAACTSCGLCVDACPQDILEVAPDGVALTPGAGECTFCGACADACPEPVFNASERMAHVAMITDDCLVQAGVTCMSCRDACPEVAISMEPRIGGPFLPRLDPSTCSGCGACAAACPADAIRAVPRTNEEEAEDA